MFDNVVILVPLTNLYPAEKWHYIKYSYYNSVVYASMPFVCSCQCRVDEVANQRHCVVTSALTRHYVTRSCQMTTRYVIIKQSIFSPL